MSRKSANRPPDTPRSTANLRHDLLATVHPLVGAIELLLTTRLTTRQRRYVNVCKRATESLMALSSAVQDNPGQAECFPRPAVDELAQLGVTYVPKPVTRGPLLETIKGFGRARPRVLVAEDSVDSCMLIQQYLRDTAQVHVVHDGKSAVDQYKTEKYDLLMIDLDMPIMDGCAAIRAIRAWETEQELSHTPIVVLTAHDLIRPIPKQESATAEEPQIVVEPDPEIAHLVPGFLAGRRHDVQTILKALTDSDYEGIRTTGHMLKGTGGGYGFDGISAIGQRLEEGAERQDFEQIREAVSDLSDYLDRVSVITQAGHQREPVHAHQY